MSTAPKPRILEPTEYIWHNGEFCKWPDVKVHMLTHTLHYGAGAFEGVRTYKTERGGAVFRLKEHMERLHYSCRAIALEIPFSVEELCKATTELLRKNKLAQGYIRPIAFFGYGIMGLNPYGAPPEVSIAAWPWGAYLPHEMVDLKISKYIRIHPKSTIADAKICGHYVNSILSVLELRGTKYHEALLLDANGNVAEGPGENIFIVKAGKLYTPPLGTILNGITRATIMTIAEDLGYTVSERTLLPKDVFEADEAFYTGTAAEVTPIHSLDDNVIGAGKVGEVTKQLRDTYLDTVYGRNKKYEQFLTYI